MNEYFIIEIIKPFGKAIVKFTKNAHRLYWQPIILEGHNFKFPSLPKKLSKEEIIHILQTYDMPWYNQIKIIDEGVNIITAPRFNIKHFLKE